MKNALQEDADRTFLPRMTALYTELNTAWDRHGDMPDHVCDLMVQATMSLGDAIINAPISCRDDIALKLRFAADMVAAKEGVILAERPAVERAMSDLMAFRDKEWHAEALILQRYQALPAPH